jgi:hypothetical protein
MDNDLNELARLIVANVEPAKFEDLVRTARSDSDRSRHTSTLDFTVSKDYGEIVRATLDAAAPQPWMLSLMLRLRLAYPEIANELGTHAGIVAQKYMVNAGDLQTAYAQVGAFYAWKRSQRAREPIHRHVCLIRIDNRASGTGLLVDADKVLTAQHVLRDAIESKVAHTKIKVVFDFFESDDGSDLYPGVPKEVAQNWLIDPWSPAHPNELVDKQFPPDDKQFNELDFALIQLAEKVGNEDTVEGVRRGWTHLRNPRSNLSFMQIVHVSQHRDGQALEGSSGVISTLPAHGLRVRYTAHTRNVSSGSPCWNQDYELVAIHTFGGEIDAPARENQGVPIAKIIQALPKDLLAPPPPPDELPPPVAPRREPYQTMWTLGANYPVLNRRTLQRSLTDMEIVDEYADPARERWIDERPQLHVGGHPRFRPAKAPRVRGGHWGADA